MRPTTKYAKRDNINIAYQVVGQGAVDIVYIPGWVSNIDMMWVDSNTADFLTSLTRFSRLILFDKRGTGLSDRVNPTCSLDERMDDILSVLDAVGIEKAIFFGHSEGGTIACLFAARYPERTISIITFGGFAKRKYSLDYPWAPKPKEREVFYSTIINHWGNGQKMGLDWIMPSMAKDNNYYTWFASYLRSSASPKSALALAKMNTESDITDIIHSINVPTLILHRKEDKDVLIEEAKYLSDRIPHSKLVELEGNDHCFWVGDSFAVISEMEHFITGKKRLRKKHYNRSIRTKYAKIDIEHTMLNHFQLNLRMVEFAKLCGRSLSSFKRDFAARYKTTPSRWLKVKRLEYARTLLLESDLNVNQVCYESGFKNNSHFIESFKEVYKHSPLKFRLRHSKF